MIDFPSKSSKKPAKFVHDIHKQGATVSSRQETTLKRHCMSQCSNFESRQVKKGAHLTTFGALHATFDSHEQENNVKKGIEITDHTVQLCANNHLVDEEKMGLLPFSLLDL